VGNAKPAKLAKKNIYRNGFARFAGFAFIPA
jgi:hypothetical protein